VSRLENKLDITIERTLEFLEDVFKNEYAEVLRIWTLPSMTEEVWKNYKTIFDNQDFDEIKLLKKARRALKGRYVAFFNTKTRETRSEDTASNC